jgi:hypothetical protein
MNKRRKYIGLKWRAFLSSPYLWVGVIIILLGAILFALLPCMQFDGNYTGLILSFVGIMSTFVVISNYAQVKDVESSTMERIRELENKNTTLIARLETLNKEYSSVIEESYKTQKSIYEQQIRSYYPRFKDYLYIISVVQKAGIWQNKSIERKYCMGGNNLTCEERKADNNQYPFLNLLLRIREMSMLYSRLVTEETVELISYEEIEALTDSANALWWAHDREWEYYKDQINEDAFIENIEAYTRQRILRIVKELAPDYKLDIVDYATIAMVSGIVETDILQPLKLLTAQFQSIEHKQKQAQR